MGKFKSQGEREERETHTVLVFDLQVHEESKVNMNYVDFDLSFFPFFLFCSGYSDTGRIRVLLLLYTLFSYKVSN